jgi:Flp pilus assembly pilin Flp
MWNLLKRLFRLTDAQDLIEYALLSGMISLACLGAIAALGGNVQGSLGNVQVAVTDAGSPGDGNTNNGNGGNGNSGNGGGSGGGGKKK